MMIQRAKVYGMCFGVRDAIAKAETLAQSGPVTVLGQLVHNPTVLETLRQKSVRVDDTPERAPLAAGKTYLITAHGVSDAQREAWQRTGAVVHDTTCPLVRRAHERLRELVARGLHPVVIGKPGHVEVRGLIGDFPGATVIGEWADIVKLPWNRDLGVVSQTTQPIDVVHDLVRTIELARPDQRVVFTDTVCQPTRDRQNALHELCAAVQVVIVIGGAQSNNTRQLLLAALSYGVRAYQVERAADLRDEWLEGIERVGLTAGTSTPENVVDEVEQAIGEMDRRVNKVLAEHAEARREGKISSGE